MTSVRIPRSQKVTVTLSQEEWDALTEAAMACDVTRPSFIRAQIKQIDVKSNLEAQAIHNLSLLHGQLHDLIRIIRWEMAKKSSGEKNLEMADMVSKLRQLQAQISDKVRQL